MTEPSIIATDLRKTFRVGDVEIKALRGVNLQVHRGEFLAIVGHSGSGKSTLFNILGGLTPPTSGHVAVDGRDLSAMGESERAALRRSAIGFVFQKYNLLPTLSAEDNIKLAQSLAGKNGRAKDANFAEALQLLGLSHRLHHKPRALSGGEQQRVAIARAIVNNPAILLADEPTGNLDTENSTIVLGLMRDLNERLGQTIVMITHNPEAAAYAHRTERMKDGCIVT